MCSIRLELSLYYIKHHKITALWIFTTIKVYNYYLNIILNKIIIINTSIQLGSLTLQISNKIKLNRNTKRR